MKNKKIIKKLIPTVVFGGIVVSSLPVYVFAGIGESLKDDLSIIERENFSIVEEEPVGYLENEYSIIEDYDDLSTILSIIEREYSSIVEEEPVGYFGNEYSIIDEEKEKKKDKPRKRKSGDLDFEDNYKEKRNINKK